MRIEKRVESYSAKPPPDGGRSPKPCPCCGQCVRVPTVKFLVLACRMQPLMQRILRVIWKGHGQPVLMPAILNAICAARDKNLSATDQKLYLSFKVALHHLRNKMRGSGVSVDNVGYGHGYRIVFDADRRLDADWSTHVEALSLAGRLPNYIGETNIDSHARGVIEGFLRDVPALRDKANATGEGACPCCEQRAIVPSLNHIVEKLELTNWDECFLRAVWNGQGAPVMAVKLIEALFADDVDGDLSLGHGYRILIAAVRCSLSALPGRALRSTTLDGSAVT